MCSAYWNLMAEVACPRCGVSEERELQTHWMGDIGSCSNFYTIGQRVDELRNIERAVCDDFIAECAGCEKAEHRWQRCGYCEGTHQRKGEVCTHCAEEVDGVWGWWVDIKWFDCAGQVVDECVTEVWALELTTKSPSVEY